MTNKTWMALGDVNPMEHGGAWVKHDEGTCFYVVTWHPSEDEENMGNFADSYVDLSDSWQDHEAVGSWADWQESTPDEIKSVDMVTYYGTLNFGSGYTLISVTEALENLKRLEIEVNGE
jgi:hypothetical protein